MQNLLEEELSARNKTDAALTESMHKIEGFQRKIEVLEENNAVLSNKALQAEKQGETKLLEAKNALDNALGSQMEALAEAKKYADIIGKKDIELSTANSKTASLEAEIFQNQEQSKKPY